MEKRIDWIDFAKGFTILFVVLGHSISSMSGSPIPHIMNGINMLIFTFVMPVFFTLSGYLYRNINTFKSYICLIFKKISALLIPYLVFSIVIYFARLDNNLKFILNLYKFPLEYTWFLYALFFIFCIFGLMDYLAFNNYIKTSIIIVFYIFSFILHSPQFPEYSGISLTFMFLPFFFIGYLMREDYINVKKLFNNKYILIISIILFIISELFYRDVFNISGYGTNMTPINFIPKVIIVLMLLYFFQSINNNILNVLGRNSIVIYLIHYPCLVITSNLLIGQIYILRLIMFFLLSLTVSIIFVQLSSNEMIKIIFYPRQWIEPLVKKTRFGKWLFS